MGARVEQPGEFLPCAGRARRCHLEDLADSLHRLPSAAEDLQVIIFRSNRALLLQGEFRITLSGSVHIPPVGLSAAPVAHTGGGMQNGPIWRGEMRMVLTRILAVCLSNAVTIA